MSQNREETEKSNIDPPPIMTEKLSSSNDQSQPSLSNASPSNTDNIETESKENNHNKNNKNSKNIPFHDDINKIYKHIEDNSMTKEIFDTFWNKIQGQLTDYQQKLEQLQIANKK